MGKKGRLGDGKDSAKPETETPSSTVRIRDFRSSDYQSVFDLVAETSVEPWTQAYWNTVNMSKVGTD